MSYASNHLVSAQNGGGGVALLWKQEIEVEVMGSTNNYIETKITHEGRLVYTTFVYEKLDHTKRKAVWEQLNLDGTAKDAPWFLTRDFNEIIDNSEKQGGLTRSEGSFVDFGSFMLESDLYDLPHSGNFYSWRSTRNNHSLMQV